MIAEEKRTLHRFWFVLGCIGVTDYLGTRVMLIVAGLALARTDLS